MKRPTRKRTERQTKEEQQTVGGGNEGKAAVEAAPVRSVGSGHQRDAGEPPDPGILLQLAQSEPDALLLADYIEVIHTLRQDKRFSFREIAAWLTEQAVPTDHNAVYREYMEWIHDPEGYQRARDLEAEQIEHEQQNT